MESDWQRFALRDGTSTLPLNTYSHIAVTYNGSSLVFYVNGVATGSTAVTGNIQTSTLPLRIGGNAIWGEYFQGQIDELRVYNRALSQNEIQPTWLRRSAAHRLGHHRPDGFADRACEWRDCLRNDAR